MTNKLVEKQIENILVAQAMMQDISNKQLAEELNFWTNEAFDESVKNGTFHCGAAACFGGWCAVEPHFRKQGLKANSAGEPVFKDPTLTPSEVSERLFGDFQMFMARRWGEEGTERQIVQARLRHALGQAVSKLEERND